MTLRAQRSALHLDKQETVLLLQINASIAPERQQRFDELVVKRQAETLTADELRELIDITEFACIPS